MSKIEVDKVDPQSGTALEIGTSGDTITVPSGVTLTTTNATVNLPASVGGLGTGITNAQLAGSIDVTTKITGVVPAANLGTGSASATTVLYGDGTFKAEPGGVNTPAFEASLSANQGIADVTATKVEFDTETFDTDGCYDNSVNYRFTPTTAGKYYVYSRVQCDAQAASNFVQAQIQIFKNGAKDAQTQMNMSGAKPENIGVNVFSIIDMDGASDYLEIFAYIDDSASTPTVRGGAFVWTVFGAFKILT